MAERQDFQAWCWLCAVPRDTSLPYRQMDQQVIVRLMPGTRTLRPGAGMTGTRVTLRYPGQERRFHGTGNTLLEAVDRVWADLTSAGVAAPHPLYATEEELEQWRTGTRQPIA